MRNLGWTKEKAQAIETRYHELYAESDKWINDKLEQASKDGYVTVAFGLRVRTPLLKQVILNNSKTPFAASAEGRTAGNALGQSWCLLNSRASNEFRAKVRASKHRLSIRPCAHIHDAQYSMIRDDIDVMMFTNEHLVKAVQWQDHPDIRHPDVGLGGELSIFWPSWKDEMEIPNGASEEEIRGLIQEHVESL
jgi:DNA polymerase-1